MKTVKFICPPLRFHALWAINGPLDAGRLRSQLTQFKELGLDGVVFHPRFYPNEPAYLGDEYLAQVSETILQAKALGLSFWIYDEDGWPSGTVGGQLLKQHPEVAQHWAGLVKERPQMCLAEFEHGGQCWFLADRKGAGVDYLNRDLAKHFITMTYERYRVGLSPDAFAYVETFFCDEPEFGLGHAYDHLPVDGAIPWTPELPALYQARFGEDLMAKLPLLFFPGEGYREARVRFWEFLGELFCEAFLQPLNAWCAKQGKLFAAHIKGEEHPLFQVPLVGSCDRVFRHLSLPGIDALERFPANDYYPRQLVSAARQFGSGRCMAEAFGGAGWGARPEDLERYLLWLGRHGVTDFVMHLAQYRLDSAAICDWPPSQPLHLNWREVYPEVLRRVRAELAASAYGEANTLLISPHRAIAAEYEPRELLQTNIHNAATYPDSVAARINRLFLEQVDTLQKSGVEWHVTDEDTFESCAVWKEGEVLLGKCTYDRVVKAEGVVLSEEWAEAVKPNQLTDISIEPAKSASVLPSEMVIPVWCLLECPENALLLEPEEERNGWFSCHFACHPQLSGMDGIEARFADDVSEVWFNGRRIEARLTENGSVVKLTGFVEGGLQILGFNRHDGRAKPSVWLHGRFRVLSRTAFITASLGGMLKTPGLWMLAAQTGAMPGDFIAEGFPFMRSPVFITATILLSRPTNRLQMKSIEADAARLVIDDMDHGWMWGPDWHLDARLEAGLHRLRLTMIPNTYNYFGPHRYFRGDWHVVSPDQFSGRRNFADPVDSPTNTHVGAWHFVPFRAPRQIRAFE